MVLRFLRSEYNDKKMEYALIVAVTIVVGANAGPVMAASPGTTGVSAPAPADIQATTAAGPVPDTGANGAAAGYIVSSSVTPPRFEWYVATYPADTASTLVYTVPSGYKLQIDDVLINYFGASGVTYAYLYRGTGELRDL